MYGLFQTCFYFGQISVLCLGVGIVCGTMGYLGARVFVFRIFKGMKGD
jgi:transmembrane 9 superfamily protein 3